MDLRSLCTFLCAHFQCIFFWLKGRWPSPCPSLTFPLVIWILSISFPLLWADRGTEPLGNTHLSRLETWVSSLIPLCSTQSPLRLSPKWCWAHPSWPAAASLARTVAGASVLVSCRQSFALSVHSLHCFRWYVSKAQIWLSVEQQPPHWINIPVVRGCYARFWERINLDKTALSHLN